MLTRHAPAAFLASVFLGPVLMVSAQSPVNDRPRYAGPTDKGFLLPNGWTVTPAGKHVVLADMPLNILPLVDNRHALVATSGYNKHELSLVNFADLKVTDTQAVRQSWFGLVLAPQQDRVWWSAGGAGMLHAYAIKQAKLVRTGPEEPDPAKLSQEDRDKLAKKTSFKGGLFHDAASDTLYSLDINDGTLSRLKAADASLIAVAPCGKRPYDIARGRNSALLYVSDWADSAVLAVEPRDLRVLARIRVGEHPNQLLPHHADDRLFVACASSNCVSVIDTKRGIVIETIMTALFPRSPEGTTPNALALAPDGKVLYVANADNNNVAVIDVAEPGKSQVKGFIPTGWYPTSVAVTPDGKNLLVGVGKGNQTRPNPFVKNQPGNRKDTLSPAEMARLQESYPYIGTTLFGALSVLSVPDEKQLGDYTAQVYRNCPYSDKLLTGAPSPQPTAIPTKVGSLGPIKYVIYIIKENRTYDQVFGDMKQGNGDPSLVMFGEKVTPNHHKLAREFVLLDNLYCNGQVSADGHPWSTMAYNTDYIARDWHLTYSGRKGVRDDAEGHLSNGPSGYLWDACARAGLTYRSYGEYGKRVSQPDGSFRIDGAVPGLVGHMCPDYGLPAKDGKYPRDPEFVRVFLREYDAYEKNGTMPRFIIMSLGEDHTYGTALGHPIPSACVGSNDLALGLLVERVSRGKLWNQTAIFVIEDDAQNGPDHVDAHRTVGLAISPYIKRGSVDSTQYSTVSLIRTMELILGLAPLSQYDAAARPMFQAFTDKPDLTPYDHEAPRINIDEMNTKEAYGVERSNKMDFSDYDRVDDFELNEILWRSIKGVDAPLPPTVRRAIANRPADRAPRK